MISRKVGNIKSVREMSVEIRDRKRRKFAVGNEENSVDRFP